MKFDGPIDDLKTIVTGMGRNINSCTDNGKMHQIKTDECETLNLYRNGTLQVQGSPAVKQKFEDDYNKYNGSPLATSPVSAQPTLTTTTSPGSSPKEGMK